MLENVIAYVVTAAIFLVLDLLWLSKVAKSFYFSRLGPLLLERPRLSIAATFYALYVIGIIIFAVSPALRLGSADHALVYGALFGFFAYATYDVTNYATLKNWSSTVTFVDIAWGTTLTGLSAYLGTLATQWVLALL
ncbi:MAG: DUF2177 family protein [Hyphomicrobiaceae bacterium]